MDTLKPTGETYFLLNVPNRCMEDDSHFCALLSGESALYNQHPPDADSFLPGQPGDIITALIHSSNVSSPMTTYSVTVRISELLDLGNLNKGCIFWNEWKDYAVTLESEHAPRRCGGFSVSGRRLMGPLQNPKDEEPYAEINEFVPECKPDAAPSDRSSSENTGSAPRARMVATGSKVVWKRECNPTGVEDWRNSESVIFGSDVNLIAVCGSLR